MSNVFAKPSGRPTDSSLMDAMKDRTGTEVSNKEVIRIHKDFLRADPNQPRKFFSEEELERRRLQLENDSQQELITVWPGVEDEDGNTYYDILDGECRWRSILRSETVDYLDAQIERRIERGNRAETLLSQLLHNDDGAAPLTALERAYAYRDIVEDYEAQGIESPRGAAAKKLGLSQAAFSEVLSLANLPEELGQFAMAQGITDAKVLNYLVQIHKRGTPEDVALVKERVEGTLAEGGSLRPAVKEVVDKVKTRKPKKAAAAKKGKKKEKKPARTVTAREAILNRREDGSGILTVESRLEVFKLDIPKEQLDGLLQQLAAPAGE